MFKLTRTPLGRLRATCDHCGDSTSGPQPAVSRWQREHTKTCPLLTAPSSKRWTA